MRRDEGKFAKQTSNGSAKAETMSKESIFSDLNNLEVVTTLTPKYETAFGFTEEEVFKALDEQGLSDKKTMLRYGMTVLDLAVKMIFIIRGR